MGIDKQMVVDLQIKTRDMAFLLEGKLRLFSLLICVSLKELSACCKGGRLRAWLTEKLYSLSVEAVTAALGTLSVLHLGAALTVSFGGSQPA